MIPAEVNELFDGLLEDLTGEVKTDVTISLDESLLSVYPTALQRNLRHKKNKQNKQQQTTFGMYTVVTRPKKQTLNRI